MVDELTPDLVVISEANYNERISNHLNFTQGYNTIRTIDASQTGFSRLVVLTREGLKYEVIWIKIPQKSKKPLIIGCVYREHQLMHEPNLNETSQEIFQVRRWRAVLRQWEAASLLGETFIIGDTILDNLKWNNPDQGVSTMVEDTKNSVITRGFSQIVTEPTRFWVGKTPSLIDQIWTNAPEKIIEYKNRTRSVADHNIVSCIIRLKGNPKTSQEVLRRNWKNVNIEELKHKMNGKNWDEIYEHIDPNLAYNSLETKILELLDELLPIKKCQIKNGNKIWLSGNTRQLMEDRDVARNKAAATNSQDDWKLYKTLRNKCTIKVRQDRKNQLNQQFNECIKNNDAKQLFNITKKRWGNKNGGPPTQFQVDGKAINKPAQIAETQINYFSEKINKLKQDIPNTITDPLRQLREAMRKWRKADNRKMFTLENITILETLEHIRTLGNTTTMGNNGIDAMTIKLNAAILSGPICHIINQSINTGKFCTKWKLGKTIPLFKGGKLNKFKPASYRPIAILPVISKLMEKTIQKQLINFMETTEQTNKNSHAYKTMHSTITALMQITDYVAEAADRNLVANLMIIDQSAALECVDKLILDQKMAIYNFSQHTRAWFRDYLSDRSHYVAIGAHKSSIRNIQWGVPQGSVLGPTSTSSTPTS